MIEKREMDSHWGAKKVNKVSEVEMSFMINVVLVKSFVEKHNIELIGDACDNYIKVWNAAEEEGEEGEEVIDCLLRIDHANMIDNCFGVRI